MPRTTEGQRVATPVPFRRYKPGAQSNEKAGGAGGVKSGEGGACANRKSRSHRPEGISFFSLLAGR